MVSSRTRHWILGAVIALGVLVIAGIAAMHFSARALKQNIVDAMGPESEVAQVEVGLKNVVITGILVKAPKGWPADSTLRAERVVVVPDIRQLLSRQLYIRHVRIENAYISAVRPKGGGGLKVLPSMLGDDRKRKTDTTGRSAEIAIVELSNCVVEMFDATVTGRQKLRVDAVHGTLRHVHVPKLEGRTEVDLKGSVRGAAHQGTVAVAGWVDVAAKSSELVTRVRNVDLLLFQPYVIQKAKAGIDQGTFNLDLKATVRNNVLSAPGTLTLTGLKLSEGAGPLGALSTVPQRAVLGTLADKEDRVTLEFELKGNLDNPAFSLTEGLGLRTGAAILKGLGLGFEALIKAFFALVSGFA